MQLELEEALAWSAGVWTTTLTLHHADSRARLFHLNHLLQECVLGNGTGSHSLQLVSPEEGIKVSSGKWMCLYMHAV